MLGGLDLGLAVDGAAAVASHQSITVLCHNEGLGTATLTVRELSSKTSLTGMRGMDSAMLPSSPRGARAERTDGIVVVGGTSVCAPSSRVASGLTVAGG